MADSTRTVRRHASAWELIDLTSAPAGGPVAFGHDLSSQNLLAAYQHGLYPFPAGSLEHTLINELTYQSEVESGRITMVSDSGEPYSVAWWSPDPRPLIFTDQAHLPRSLRQQLRNKLTWVTTVDTCFRQVVLECRAGRTQRWLTDDLVTSLCELHDRGHAHSVEVWDGDELIAGTFGVHVGSVFSADSQFTMRSGAAKVAVADMARRFADIGGVALDVQHDSDHVRRLGARLVPRTQYLELLRTPTVRTALSTEPLPARRLAE
jgi:leucyl/phenylalanyl-tRNA---protein transferase